MPKLTVIIDKYKQKRKSMSDCQNCGHNCHCGGKCKQEIVNENGEKYKIECCGHCRHKEEEKINDITALFNGA